ncbi:hypothetical protein COY45_01075 [Candidatus Berkelbacteria bacterium CG_4_10_14_0_8_um_filter_42_34]|uniref:Uncharacterized protein n=2 Tax=Candidatus Berkelbacteria TaxID=1618330 RepID=A0A2M7SWZ9_9BACT|nr:MAG: hypothetical protein COY45_01075 [Candidatus Berkelbacteria bacterium CG_4_10_14_0_8_um_filter_42_34]
MLPKFWDVFLKHQRLKAGIEFELGLFVQKVTIAGAESYTLYDDQGCPISRGDMGRVDANFSLDTSGVAGFFVGRPWMLAHTHPTVLNESEDQVANIVDLPSDTDLSDVDLHKMIIWGAEKLGFYATVIERPETPEEIEAYQQATKKYRLAVESDNQSEMRRILLEELGGKFYRLVESGSDTFKAVSPKQAGMSKEELRLSSGVESPVTDFIYQQDDYRDRRYTLCQMTDEEERQTTQDFYHNIEELRMVENNRVEQRRRIVAAKCSNMPKDEILMKLDSLRVDRETCAQRLADITDSAERTNLTFEMKNKEIDISVLEALISPMAG